MARFNVGNRAKVCTPPTHKCRPGKKGEKKVTCLDGCCRSRYARSAVASSMDNAIDPRKLLNDEEYNEAIELSKKLEDPVGISIRFIAETGARLGEALLVKVQDVEIRKGELSIVRIPTLKRGGRPVRTVYLMNSGWIVPELSKWIRGKGPAELLFPVARRTLQKKFEKILDEVKPERAGLVHLLRHTRASKLIQSGMPANTVRQQLGWSSIEMLQIYAHTTEGEVAKALGKI